MVEGRHEGDSPTGGLVQGLAVAGLLRTTIRVRLQDTLGQHEKQALLRTERPEALTGALLSPALDPRSPRGADIGRS